jgi:hypothetical protein
LQCTHTQRFPAQVPFAEAVLQVQVLTQAPPEVAHSVLRDTPISLLRLLAILPRSLHTLAIDSRTTPGGGADSSALVLADCKDVPRTAAAAALDAFVLHASRLQSLRAFRLSGIAGGMLLVELQTASSAMR